MPDGSPKPMRNVQSRISVTRVGPSKDQLRRARNARVVEKLENWWWDVENSGVLLPESAEQGKDYMGALPWPELVSIRTLYAYYVSNVYGQDIANLDQFRFELRRLANLTRKGEKTIRVKKPSGRGTMPLRVSFYFLERRR